MKIRQLIILSLWPLIVTPSFAFDTEAYCKKVAEAAGGSYQIYEACLKDENRAKDRVGGDSSNSKFVPFLKNKDFKVSVDENSFQTLGSATIFQKITEYNKQQTKDDYDEKTGKFVKMKFWKELEIVAVICITKDNSRLIKMASSGATIITSVLLNKSGKTINQTPNSWTSARFKKVKNYEQVHNGFQADPFRFLIEGTLDEINYQIGCER